MRYEPKMGPHCTSQIPNFRTPKKLSGDRNHPNHRNSSSNQERFGVSKRVSPWKINMEHANHPFRKEKWSSKPLWLLLCSMLIFQGGNTTFHFKSGETRFLTGPPMFGMKLARKVSNPQAAGSSFYRSNFREGKWRSFFVCKKTQSIYIKQHVCRYVLVLSRFLVCNI